MQNNLHSFVTRFLEDRLSPFYYYHNLEHTLYVTAKAIEIGGHEGCSREEIELLTAAALFHDTGYVNSSSAEGHEEESVSIARQQLPAFGYTPDAIAAISEIIMATKMPHAPQNKLHQIIADADLAYLADENASQKAGDLYRELQHLDPTFTQSAWTDVQIAFLIKHRYFTSYAKKAMEPMKREYLNRLLNGVE